MLKTLFAPLTLALLASCGGGGTSTPSQVEVLRAEALAKEVQARALAVDQPCLLNSQCEGLQFGATDNNCVAPPPKTYSLISPSARDAEKAAAEQRALAKQVLDLLPIVICAQAPVPTPTYSCQLQTQKCISS